MKHPSHTKIGDLTEGIADYKFLVVLEAKAVAYA